MNGFPQDPNLHSWKALKAVVIPHGSPAHLRSGIKREFKTQLSSGINQNSHANSVQFKGIFGDNAASRAPIDRLPKIYQKILGSHFPIFLYIFPKVDFDGKT